ncbi:MAG: ligase-associated DNA damage response DEXH box helicase [Fimbriimonadaceae bacterium]|nr:ligase-associated DNA damage response DEXH box helicase [Fimbriimonadaceae bacterium]
MSGSVPQGVAAALGGAAPLEHQLETWQAISEGWSGLLHSPTGTGKTLAVWLGFLQSHRAAPGLKAVWVTPLRSLAADTASSLQAACDAMELGWRVELRTGDVPSSARQKQLKDTPDVLVTTPESLTLLQTLLAAREFFSSVQLAVVDEWHELLGSKRGVQTELAVARLRRLQPEVRVWGLSATLGNLPEALEVLVPDGSGRLIAGRSRKEIVVDSLLPEVVERFPWAGHMGDRMIPQVAKELDETESALIFCNTRAQAEIWHQALVQSGRDWADRIALHHGSLDAEVRERAEQGLKRGELRAVVCTSSLDLGVDFSPVERVFQIGSPKGIARLLQRAGRSGHRPGAASRVTCVPTHAWELIDIAAVRLGIERRSVEGRAPIREPFDVLVQHLATSALGRGFVEDELFAELRSTWSFRDLSPARFDWALDFVSRGGDTLRAYPEFRKVAHKEGRWIMPDPETARRHRAGIGTIVADLAMDVRLMSGGRLGSVEESFVSRLKRGDRFTFAGRLLEFVMVKEQVCLVKPSKKATGLVPRWGGGRLPLSSNLAEMVRERLDQAREGELIGPEMEAAVPLLRAQMERSALPAADELLVELLDDDEGRHLFLYPMEGRLVHEGLAALLAVRLSRGRKVSFSLACNDHGLELFSAGRFDVEADELQEAFSVHHLVEDIWQSLNESEMSKRRFREIARVAGLIFVGFPGQKRSG